MDQIKNNWIPGTTPPSSLASWDEMPIEKPNRKCRNSCNRNSDFGRTLEGRCSCEGRSRPRWSSRRGRGRAFPPSRTSCSSWARTRARLGERPIQNRSVREAVRHALPENVWRIFASKHPCKFVDRAKRKRRERKLWGWSHLEDSSQTRWRRRLSFSDLSKKSRKSSMKSNEWQWMKKTRKSSMKSNEWKWKFWEEKNWWF